MSNFLLMKNKLNLCLSLVSILSVGSLVHAQISLGSASSFVRNIKNSTAKSAKGELKTLPLKVKDNLNFEAQINYQKSEINGEYLVGEVKNFPGSTFVIKASNNAVEGKIILMNTKEAYSYYTDKSGNVYSKEVDINSLVCVNSPVDNSSQKGEITDSNYKVDPALLKLESFPGAPACILFDFDGYELPAGTQWNGGRPISAKPAGLSDASIKTAFEIAAEDFKPFNINLTTNEAVFKTYPKNRRMRAVATTTTTAAPGSGGVAYIGSFNWDTEDPCWVFNLSAKACGETISHEVGHTLDLKHDGRRTPSEQYFVGLSNTPYGPIMGAPFSRPLVQWSKGEYESANNTQDDLVAITAPKFGFGYRKDDYGNTTADASPLSFDAGGVVKQKDGIIVNQEDIDFFTFTTSGTGEVKINANAAIRQGNLDILMKLYDSKGTEIGSFTDDTAGVLNTSFTKTLNAGKYFISIKGTGSGDPKKGGYSAYGSIGTYSITGTVKNAVLGSEDFELNAVVSTYPVPFTDEFKFTVNENLEGLKTTLYDYLGKVQKINVTKENGNTYKVDASGLSQGIYFLKLQTDKGSKTTKIVKE
jgi:hypothetical protein